MEFWIFIRGPRARLFLLWFDCFCKKREREKRPPALALVFCNFPLGHRIIVSMIAFPLCIHSVCVHVCILQTFGFSGVSSSRVSRRTFRFLETYDNPIHGTLGAYMHIYSQPVSMTLEGTKTSDWLLIIGYWEFIPKGYFGKLLLPTNLGEVSHSVLTCLSLEEFTRARFQRKRIAKTIKIPIK